MPKIIIFLIGCLFMSAHASTKTNAYDFSFQRLTDNEPLALSEYQGKVLFIVNVASKCGFTSQYKNLESLYKQYKDRGLIILGVPSNDFGSQEPGSSEEISHFCKSNYGVSFPMAAKEVVSGSKAHPFYLWAREQLGFGSAPKWNFHKYLVDKQGKLVTYYYSTTSPDAPRVTKAIEKALAE